jgi:hypothetical protein
MMASLQFVKKMSRKNGVANAVRTPGVPYRQPRDGDSASGRPSSRTWSMTLRSVCPSKGLHKYASVPPSRPVSAC